MSRPADLTLSFNDITDLPEWVQQFRNVEAGLAKWDDYTFRQRACKGWLWPYLLLCDERVGSKRWLYWVKAMADQKMPDGPIPKIDFLGSPHDGTMKMLRNCLENHMCLMASAGHSEFFDWILWGVGDGGQEPRVSEKLNEFWYKNFNLSLMIENPNDYLGDLISEAREGRTYWTNPNAFFPTPHPVAKAMTDMTMQTAGIGDKDMRLASVFEPCVGTGRMLMEASNYSVNLYGFDIDPICIRACKINGYLYMPWMVRPAGWMPKPEPEAFIEQAQKATGKIIPDVQLTLGFK